jgi:hypothetical protein
MLVWKAMPSHGADDVADLLAGRADVAHRGHHALNHRAALAGDVRSRGGQLAGSTGAVGALLDGGGHLLLRRGGLLQRAGLLLGAARQVVVARGDLRRRSGDAFGRQAHLAYHRHQADVHPAQRGEQLARLVVAVDHDVGAEVAVGHGLGQHHAAFQRAGDRRGEHPAQRQRDQHGGAADGHHGHAVGGEAVLGDLHAFMGQLLVIGDVVAGRLQQRHERGAAVEVHPRDRGVLLPRQRLADDVVRDLAVLRLDPVDLGQQRAIALGDVRRLGARGLQGRHRRVDVGIGLQHGGLLDGDVGGLRHQHQVARGDRASRRGPTNVSGQWSVVSGQWSVVGGR